MSFRSQIWDGTKWVSLAAGSGSAPVFDLLHSKKAFADTPDDEFGSTVLDPKWTVVSGAVGVVDPLLAAATVTEIYDLTSRPGWFLIQVGTADNVEIRQDYTLPDGRSITIALAVAHDEYSGDNQNFKMVLNDADTASGDGENITIMAESDTTEWAIQGNSDTDSSGQEVLTASDVNSNLVFLRIMRDDLDYSTWFSMNGITWTHVFTDTHADVADNVWISMLGSTSGTHASIGAVAWIREGSNDLDPWDPHAAVSVAQQEFGTLQFYEPELSSTIVGDMPLYTWSNRRITAIRASVGTAPSGGTVDVNVVVNGTTDALTTDLSILTTETTAGTTTINNPNWGSGAYLTVDVPAVQAPAADLIVYVEWEDT